MGDDPYTSKYKAVFSPNILSSLNLMPVHRPDNLNQLVYHPFGVYHDFINWALFVQNKATGEYKMILCNQDDAEQFMSMLEKDSKNPAEGKRTAKAFLYHFGLDNGIVAQGRDRVDSKQLHADPDFVSLLTQGKFLNGALNYDDQEKKVLAKWAGQHGEGEMRNLFLSVILAYRESIRSRFESSDISDVL